MKVLLLLIPLSLFGFCRETAEVGAKLVYWKPIDANDHYATIWQAPDQSDLGERRFLKPHYNWGWQVDARWILPECDLVSAFNVTSIVFHSRDSKGSTGLFIDDVGNEFVEGVARISSKQKYVSGDLETGLRFLERLTLRLEFLAGVRYSFLVTKRDNRATSSVPVGVNTRKGTSTFSGAGPRIHLSFAGVELLPNTTFTLHTAAALLIGRRKLTASESNTIRYDFEVGNQLRETVPVPDLDLRVQIQYSVCSALVSLTGEVGYELRHYFLPLYQPEPVSIEAPVPRTKRLGFAGPYAALRIGF